MSRNSNRMAQKAPPEKTEPTPQQLDQPVQAVRRTANTEFVELPKTLICAGFSIKEYDNEIPSNLTADQILIRSGNIGSVRIG